MHFVCISVSCKYAFEKRLVKQSNNFFYLFATKSIFWKVVEEFIGTNGKMHFNNE